MVRQVGGDPQAPRVQAEPMPPPLTQAPAAAQRPVEAQRTGAAPAVDDLRVEAQPVGPMAPTSAQPAIDAPQEPQTSEAPAQSTGYHSATQAEDSAISELITLAGTQTLTPSQQDRVVVLLRDASHGPGGLTAFRALFDASHAQASPHVTLEALTERLTGRAHTRAAALLAPLVTNPQQPVSLLGPVERGQENAALTHLREERPELNYVLVLLQRPSPRDAAATAEWEGRREAAAGRLTDPTAAATLERLYTPQAAAAIRHYGITDDDIARFLANGGQGTPRPDRSNPIQRAMHDLEQRGFSAGLGAIRTLTRLSADVATANLSALETRIATARDAFAAANDDTRESLGAALSTLLSQRAALYGIEHSSRRLVRTLPASADSAYQASVSRTIIAQGTRIERTRQLLVSLNAELRATPAPSAARRSVILAAIEEATTDLSTAQATLNPALRGQRRIAARADAAEQRFLRQHPGHGLPTRLRERLGDAHDQMASGLIALGRATNSGGEPSGALAIVATPPRATTDTNVTAEEELRRAESADPSLRRDLPATDLPALTRRQRTRRDEHLGLHSALRHARREIRAVGLTGPGHVYSADGTPQRRPTATERDSLAADDVDSHALEGINNARVATLNAEQATRRPANEALAARVSSLNQENTSLVDERTRRRSEGQDAAAELATEAQLAPQAETARRRIGELEPQVTQLQAQLTQSETQWAAYRDALSARAEMMDTGDVAVGRTSHTPHVPMPRAPTSLPPETIRAQLTAATAELSQLRPRLASLNERLAPLVERHTRNLATTDVEPGSRPAVGQADAPEMATEAQLAPQAQTARDRIGELAPRLAQLQTQLAQSETQWRAYREALSARAEAMDPGDVVVGRSARGPSIPTLVAPQSLPPETLRAQIAATDTELGQLRPRLASLTERLAPLIERRTRMRSELSASDAYAQAAVDAVNNPRLPTPPSDTLLAARARADLAQSTHYVVTTHAGEQVAAADQREREQQLTPILADIRTRSSRSSSLRTEAQGARAEAARYAREHADYLRRLENYDPDSRRMAPQPPTPAYGRPLAEIERELATVDTELVTLRARAAAIDPQAVAAEGAMRTAERQNAFAPTGAGVDGNRAPTATQLAEGSRHTSEVVQSQARLDQATAVSRVTRNQAAVDATDHALAAQRQMHPGLDRSRLLGEIAISQATVASASAGNLPEQSRRLFATVWAETGAAPLPGSPALGPNIETIPNDLPGADGQPLVPSLNTRLRQQVARGVSDSVGPALRRHVTGTEVSSGSAQNGAQSERVADTMTPGYLLQMAQGIATSDALPATDPSRVYAGRVVRGWSALLRALPADARTRVDAVEAQVGTTHHQLDEARRGAREAAAANVSWLAFYLTDDMADSAGATVDAIRQRADLGLDRARGQSTAVQQLFEEALRVRPGEAGPQSGTVSPAELRAMQLMSALMMYAQAVPPTGGSATALREAVGVIRSFDPATQPTPPHGYARESRVADRALGFNRPTVDITPQNATFAVFGSWEPGMQTWAREGGPTVTIDAQGEPHGDTGIRRAGEFAQFNAANTTVNDAQQTIEFFQNMEVFDTTGWDTSRYPDFLRTAGRFLNRPAVFNLVMETAFIEFFTLGLATSVTAARATTMFARLAAMAERSGNATRMIRVLEQVGSAWGLGRSGATALFRALRGMETAERSSSAAWRAYRTILRGMEHFAGGAAHMAQVNLTQHMVTQAAVRLFGSTSQATKFIEGMMQIMSVNASDSVARLSTGIMGRIGFNVMIGLGQQGTEQLVQWYYTHGLQPGERLTPERQAALERWSFILTQAVAIGVPSLVGGYHGARGFANNVNEHSRRMLPPGVTLESPAGQAVRAHVERIMSGVETARTPEALQRFADQISDIPGAHREALSSWRGQVSEQAARQRAIEARPRTAADDAGSYVRDLRARLEADTHLQGTLPSDPAERTAALDRIAGEAAMAETLTGMPRIEISGETTNEQVRAQLEGRNADLVARLVRSGMDPLAAERTASAMLTVAITQRANQQADNHGRLAAALQERLASAQSYLSRRDAAVAQVQGLVEAARAQNTEIPAARIEAALREALSLTTTEVETPAYFARLNAAFTLAVVGSNAEPTPEQRNLVDTQVFAIARAQATVIAHQAAFRAAQGVDPDQAATVAMFDYLQRAGFEPNLASMAITFNDVATARAFVAAQGRRPPAPGVTNEVLGRLQYVQPASRAREMFTAIMSGLGSARDSAMHHLLAGERLIPGFARLPVGVRERTLRALATIGNPDGTPATIARAVRILHNVAREHSRAFGRGQGRAERIQTFDDHIHAALNDHAARAAEASLNRSAEAQQQPHTPAERARYEQAYRRALDDMNRALPRGAQRTREQLDAAAATHALTLPAAAEAPAQSEAQGSNSNAAAGPGFRAATNRAQRIPSASAGLDTLREMLSTHTPEGLPSTDAIESRHLTAIAQSIREIEAALPENQRYEFRDASRFLIEAIAEYVHTNGHLPPGQPLEMMRRAFADAQRLGLTDSATIAALARSYLGATLEYHGRDGVSLTNVIADTALPRYQATMREMSDAIAALPTPVGAAQRQLVTQFVSEVWRIQRAAHPNDQDAIFNSNPAHWRQTIAALGQLPEATATALLQIGMRLDSAIGQVDTLHTVTEVLIAHRAALANPAHANALVDALAAAAALRYGDLATLAGSDQISSSAHASVAFALQQALVSWAQTHTAPPNAAERQALMRSAIDSVAGWDLLISRNAIPDATQRQAATREVLSRFQASPPSTEALTTRGRGHAAILNQAPAHLRNEVAVALHRAPELAETLWPLFTQDAQGLLRPNDVDAMRSIYEVLSPQDRVRVLGALGAITNPAEQAVALRAITRQYFHDLPGLNSRRERTAPLRSGEALLHAVDTSLAEYRNPATRARLLTQLRAATLTLDRANPAGVALPQMYSEGGTTNGVRALQQLAGTGPASAEDLPVVRDQVRQDGWAYAFDHYEQLREMLRTAEDPQAALEWFAATQLMSAFAGRRQYSPEVLQALARDSAQAMRDILLANHGTMRLSGGEVGPEIIIPNNYPPALLRRRLAMIRATAEAAVREARSATPPRANPFEGQRQFIYFMPEGRDINRATSMTMDAGGLVQGRNSGEVTNNFTFSNSTAHILIHEWAGHVFDQIGIIRAADGRTIGEIVEEQLRTMNRAQASTAYGQGDIREYIAEAVAEYFGTLYNDRPTRGLAERNPQLFAALRSFFGDVQGYNREADTYHHSNSDRWGPLPAVTPTRQASFAAALPRLGEGFAQHYAAQRELNNQRLAAAAPGSEEASLAAADRQILDRIMDPTTSQSAARDALMILQHPRTSNRAGTLERRQALLAALRAPDAESRVYGIYHNLIQRADPPRFSSDPASQASRAHFTRARAALGSDELASRWFDANAQAAPNSPHRAALEAIGRAPASASEAARLGFALLDRRGPLVAREVTAALAAADPNAAMNNLLRAQAIRVLGPGTDAYLNALREAASGLATGANDTGSAALSRFDFLTSVLDRDSNSGRNIMLVWSAPGATNAARDRIVEMYTHWRPELAGESAQLFAAVTRPPAEQAIALPLSRWLPDSAREHLDRALASASPQAALNALFANHLANVFEDRGEVTDFRDLWSAATRDHNASDPSVRARAEVQLAELDRIARITPPAQATQALNRLLEANEPATPSPAPTVAATPPQPNRLQTFEPGASAAHLPQLLLQPLVDARGRTVQIRRNSVGAYQMQVAGPSGRLRGNEPWVTTGAAALAQLRLRPADPALLMIDGGQTWRAQSVFVRATHIANLNRLGVSLVGPDGAIFSATPVGGGNFVVQRRNPDGREPSVEQNLGLNAVYFVNAAQLEAMRLRPADERVALELNGDVTPNGRPLTATEQAERQHAAAALAELETRRQVRAETPAASVPATPQAVQSPRVQTPPARVQTAYATPAHLPNLVGLVLRTSSGGYARIEAHPQGYIVQMAGTPEGLTMEARARSMTPAEVSALQLVPMDPTLELGANGAVHNADEVRDTLPDGIRSPFAPGSTGALPPETSRAPPPVPRRTNDAPAGPGRPTTEGANPAPPQRPAAESRPTPTIPPRFAESFEPLAAAFGDSWAATRANIAAAFARPENAPEASLAMEFLTRLTDEQLPASLRNSPEARQALARLREWVTAERLFPPSLDDLRRLMGEATASLSRQLRADLGRAMSTHMETVLRDARVADGLAGLGDAVPRASAERLAAEQPALAVLVLSALPNSPRAAEILARLNNPTERAAMLALLTMINNDLTLERVNAGGRHGAIAAVLHVVDDPVRLQHARAIMQNRALDSAERGRRLTELVEPRPLAEIGESPTVNAVIDGRGRRWVIETAQNGRRFARIVETVEYSEQARIYLDSPQGERLGPWRAEGDPTPESMFLDARATRRYAALSQAVQEGFSGQVARDMFRAAGGDAIDPTTGLDPAADRVDTLRRVIAHLDSWHTGSERSFYVEADLRNLSGMSRYLGRDVGDRHYRAMTAIFREELSSIGARGSFFRHGGDEFSSVVTGNVSQEQINGAFDRIRERVRRYIERQPAAITAEAWADPVRRAELQSAGITSREQLGFLQSLPHKKHLSDRRFDGSGVMLGVAEITPDRSPNEIFAAADGQVEGDKIRAGLESTGGPVFERGALVNPPPEEMPSLRGSAPAQPGRVPFRSQVEERRLAFREQWRRANPRGTLAESNAAADRFFREAGGEVRDPVTGFETRDASIPALRRAQERVNAGTDRALQVSISLRNLAGLNGSFGHSGANRVMQHLGAVIARHMSDLGVDVQISRDGPFFDLVLVGPNVNRAEVERRLTSAQNEVATWARTQAVSVGTRQTTLSAVPHPAHSGDRSYDGIGLSFATREMERRAVPPQPPRETRDARTVDAEADLDSLHNTAEARARVN